MSGEILLYVVTIYAVSAMLFVDVDKFEPNRRLARVLKFLILAVCAAAIVSRLVP
jgi:hypothetical protein